MSHPSVAFAAVALAAAMITTPGLTPASLVRYWLARQTARTAMARFDREWARQAAAGPRDRS